MPNTLSNRPSPQATASKPRPSVLVVDARPGTFTDRNFSREDLDVTLVRFPGELPEDYLERTAHLATFEVRPDELLSEAAERYRAFVGTLDNPPMHFCNPHEPLQEVAQEFARLVGLPHLTSRQVRWVRQKPAMKDRYRELGIRCAAYAHVVSAPDVVSFAENHSWPVIVKPSDSFACIDTYRVDDAAQMPSLPATRRWTVEEFIRGTEFQLCALVLGGTVLSAYLSKNPRPILDVLDGAMNANITYSRAEAHPFDAQEICQVLVDAFEIDHGYFHGECFVTQDGEFVMSEVAARISGCEVPENHGRAYGFDIHRAIMDTYTGKEPSLDYTKDSAVGDLLLPTMAGVVESITPWSAIATMPGVIGGRIKATIGDILDPIRASHASSGFVHVEGRNVEEVELRMQAVLDIYRLRVTPPTP